MKKKLLLLLLIALFIISAILRTGYQLFQDLELKQRIAHIPHGLKVGDKAPDFTGYDQTGKTVDLKKLLEKGPVVLFFYRGKWCPVCSRYLNNYQDSLKYYY